MTRRLGGSHGHMRGHAINTATTSILHSLSTQLQCLHLSNLYLYLSIYLSICHICHICHIYIYVAVRVTNVCLKTLKLKPCLTQTRHCQLSAAGAGLWWTLDPGDSEIGRIKPKHYSSCHLRSALLDIKDLHPDPDAWTEMVKTKIVKDCWIDI